MSTYSKGIFSTSQDDSQGLGYELPQTDSELFDLDGYPLFDEVAGINVTSNKEILKELVGILLKDTFPQETALLLQAHAKGDWAGIQAIAHKLKGSALYVGTVRLKYACQYTERYRLAGHSVLLEPLFEQLIRVIGDTSDAVTDWLGKQ